VYLKLVGSREAQMKMPTHHRRVQEQQQEKVWLVLGLRSRRWTAEVAGESIALLTRPELQMDQLVESGLIEHSPLRQLAAVEIVTAVG